MTEHDEKQSLTEASKAGESEISKAARGVSPPITLQSPTIEEVRRTLQGFNENIISMGKRSGLLNPDAGSLQVGAYPTTLNLASSAEMAQLSSRLAKIEKGLNELKTARAENKKVDEPLLDDLIEATANAKGQTENMLMARLHLPPQWLTDQQLVPVTLLERLEEYRSDENLILLFAGTFGGAILGVLSSWLVAEDSPMTRSSILFLILLLGLTTLFGYGAYRLRQRSNALKKRMLVNLRVSNEADAGGGEGAE